MEEYLEYAPLLLFLIIALGAKVLKQYIEKQQAGKEAAQRRVRPAGRQPPAAPPAGRLPEVRRQKPALPEQAIAAPRSGAAPRPTPVPPRPQAPPGVAVARQAIRQKTGRRGAPVRAARGLAAPARGQEIEAVGALDQRRLESLPAGKISALRGTELHPATERPAPAAGRRPAAGFLGSMLHGRNLARAVVLSEILGPPKGLRDV